MPEKLPPVGHMRGALLQQAVKVQDSLVVIEYADHKQKLFQLEIPFLDAMYLLNILRGMEKDSGFESQNKPPQ